MEERQVLRIWETGEIWMLISRASGMALVRYKVVSFKHKIIQLD